MIVNLIKLPDEGIARKVSIDKLFFDEYLKSDELSGVAHPCEVLLSVIPEGKNISIRGNARVGLRAVCVRCLKEFVFESDIAFDYLLKIARVASATSADDNRDFDEVPEDLSFYDAVTGTVDLGQFVAEAILLALPARMICGEGCTGIEGFNV